MLINKPEFDESFGEKAVATTMSFVSIILPFISPLFGEATALALGFSSPEVLRTYVVFGALLSLLSVSIIYGLRHQMVNPAEILGIKFEKQAILLTLVDAGLFATFTVLLMSIANNDPQRGFAVIIIITSLMAGLTSVLLFRTIERKSSIKSDEEFTEFKNQMVNYFLDIEEVKFGEFWQKEEQGNGEEGYKIIIRDNTGSLYKVVASKERPNINYKIEELNNEQ